MRKTLQRLITAVLFLQLLGTTLYAAERPNIVLIYGDDVGFGDVSCNGTTAIPTPNIDRIAAEGLRFTDAHCSAATCTPSRYALLTGTYAFRQKNSSIRAGNANLIIKPGSHTLPERLQSVGYATGVVGKWHLGLGKGPIDWNTVVKPGPYEVGFDYHFLIPATGDRVPCVYLEQGRVVDHDPADPIQVSYRKRIGDAPTGKERPDLLKQKWSHGHNSTIVNGISRIGYMSGGEKARWVDEDMADVITTKAVQFVEDHKDEEFFLFFSTHDIHVPRVPHPRFVGSTDLGPRGDAMVQLDWCVGEILAALDQHGLSENTLVIFTSDNGPVLDDGYHDEANQRLGDHAPAGPFRAGKYSKFEGGTRVPFVARWPGRISPGTTSDALFGQIDLAASLSALVGAEIPQGSCPDSRDELDTLLGQDLRGRPFLIHEAKTLALRVGPWKYVSPGTTRDQLGPWTNVQIGAAGRLYHVGEDPGENEDLASAEPDRVKKYRQLMDRIRKSEEPLLID
ncbi:MAG: arylsulfatase [Pirellulales bacterium]|nr:arylsulfatase [Pirellulales bacterium]